MEENKLEYEAFCEELLRRLSDTVEESDSIDIQYQQKGFDLLTQLEYDKDPSTKAQADALREKIQAAGDSIKSTIKRLQQNEKMKKALPI